MSRANLLLVDADERNRRVLEVSLRKAEFCVTTAVNGNDALHQVGLAEPDLIISDTQLPELDGFTFCELLKANPNWATIPFVFLTRSSSVEDKIRGLELGVNEYLTKPIFVKEIIVRIKVLLQKRQREAITSRSGRTTFNGELSDMGVVDLIQMMELGRKAGIIHLVGGADERGAVYFRDGKAIDAELGPMQGQAAIYRLLTWSEGTFEVEFKPIRRKDVIELSNQALLVEGMHRVDEWGRLLEQLPQLESVFEVDYDQLSERLGELPDTVNAILRLFDGRRSLLQVVNDCPFTDLEALDIIGKLYFEGLVYDVARGRTRATIELSDRRTDLNTEAAETTARTDAFAHALQVEASHPDVGDMANGKRGAVPRPGRMAATTLSGLPPAAPSDAGADEAPKPAKRPGSLEQPESEQRRASQPAKRRERTAPGAGGAKAAPSAQNVASKERAPGSQLAAHPATKAAAGDDTTRPSEPDALGTTDRDQPPVAPKVRPKTQPGAGAPSTQSPAIQAQQAQQQAPTSATAAAGEITKHGEVIPFPSRPTDHSAPQAPQLAETPAISTASAAAAPQQAPSLDPNEASIDAHDEAFFAADYEASAYTEDMYEPQRPAFARRLRSIAGVLSIAFVCGIVAFGLFFMLFNRSTSNEQRAAAVAHKGTSQGSAVKRLSSSPPTRTSTAASVRAADRADAGLSAPKNHVVATAPSGTTVSASKATRATPDVVASHAAAPASPDAGIKRATVSAQLDGGAPNDAYDRLIAKANVLLSKHRAGPASKLLERALAINPKGWQAAEQLAMQALDRGRSGKALELALRASAVNPEAPLAQLVIGAVLQERGNTTEAKKAYENYLRLCPHCSHAGDIRAVLKSL